MSDLLTQQQAAAYLGFKPGTLAQMRWRGDGPAFLKLGKFVRYDRADLDTWARSRRYTSTSEATARAAG
jgi:predicted DNA-binding transcriptional regulator AlpA